MTWIKLDDAFADHPKIADLSDRAFRVHITALLYCGKYLTDGVIPEPIANRFCVSNARRIISKLTDTGLWKVVEGGYEINDYLKYQTSKAQAEMEKETNRLRAAKARKLRAEALRNGVTTTERSSTEAHTPTPTPTDSKKKKIKVIENDQPFDDSDFKVFWAAYPKKVKKQNALKSYIKAVKSATAQEIFEGLIRYQRVCGEDLKFVANPDSWLNQMRWTDVYEVPTISTRQNQTSNHFQSVETLQPPRITENEFFKPELTPEQLASRQKIIDQAKANTRGSRSA